MKIASPGTVFLGTKQKCPRLVIPNLRPHDGRQAAWNCRISSVSSWLSSTRNANQDRAVFRREVVSFLVVRKIDLLGAGASAWIVSTQSRRSLAGVLVRSHLGRVKRAHLLAVISFVSVGPLLLNPVPPLGKEDGVHGSHIQPVRRSPGRLIGGYLVNCIDLHGHELQGSAFVKDAGICLLNCAISPCAKDAGRLIQLENIDFLLLRPVGGPCWKDHP